MRKPVRIGVGGPVGSGKTALLDCLCKAMRDRYQLAVVTNDIFTLGCDELTYVHDLDNFPFPIAFECCPTQSNLDCPSFFLSAIRKMVWVPLKSHI